MNVFNCIANFFVRSRKNNWWRNNGGESCADEFQKHELSKKLARKTYLITYSRTNESICPEMETFSPANIRFISSK